MRPEKAKSLSEAKLRYSFPENVKFRFCTAFLDYFMKSNFKNFAHVGFCGLKVSTKFSDFAAGMEFDTKEIFNKMS